MKLTFCATRDTINKESNISDQKFSTFDLKWDKIGRMLLQKKLFEDLITKRKKVHQK